jgi:hypothetical protein
MEQFSATILQGLFDLRHRLDEELSPVPKPVDVEQDLVQDEAKYIMEAAKGLGDIEDFMRELNEARHKEKYSFCDNELDVPIVSESLYSLTIHEDLDSSDFDGVIPEYVTERHMEIFHGQIIDGAQGVLHEAIDGMAAPDEFTAENAAFAVVEETLKEAAETVGKGVCREVGSYNYELAYMLRLRFVCYVWHAYMRTISYVFPCPSKAEIMHKYKPNIKSY